MSTPSPNADGLAGVRFASGASAGGRALQRLVGGLFGRPLFWAFFVGIAFVLPLIRVLRTPLPPHLPVLGTVSDFALVDQNERPYGTSELRGRVWLASAIETASPQADKVARELGKIQHRVVNLGPAFHLVTVGLDPAIDTQAALLEFTRHRRVSPRIWSFLSGNVEAVQSARQALGLEPKGQASGGSAHGSEDETMPVILVDSRMRVRGRYDLSDPNAIDTLLYHTGLLVNRGD